ncbi:MAG: protein-glutamate O-methyltransferase CheR [Acidobacteriota bacterium]|jgi:chemotaxis protein methyltransferase CheR|nr:protein-glutamate O-methyltransferase CheR [Acidobacteriota bacterium]
MTGPAMEANLNNHYLMDISGAEFDLFRTYIHRRFGIHLTDKKRSLLVSRLQKIIRDSGFGSFQNYYDHLTKSSDRRQVQELVNRISTNHTFFNRENDHFEYFSKVALPAITASLRAKGENDLRVWCAGCSTGEEAYMLLMLMAEFFGAGASDWKAGILATDISEQVLDVAKEGVYSEDKIASLPPRLREKYTSRLGDGSYRIADRLRRDATFRRFNLMNRSYPFRKPFHVIFCRNVMIYFDENDKQKVVNRFYEVTEPGGYLFIGHSETLGRKQQAYRYIQPALYQKAVVSDAR